MSLSDDPSAADDPLAGRTSPRPPDDSPRWLEWAFYGAALLACAIALTPTMADPDLWGHVQYGRDALREGLSATTTHSFTAGGYRWINHENLAEIVFALGADSLGGSGMVWVKCLVGLGILGIIIGRCRRFGLDLVTICLMALLVAVNLTFHWSMRPQLFTYVSFALMLLLLSRAFAGWEYRWHLPWFRKLARSGDETDSAASNPDSLPANASDTYNTRRLRWLWLAVPLFFVWANSHGGFVAGWCIFAAILGLRGLELFATRGRAALPSILRLTIILTATGLATLINPYGPGLHVWLLGSLGTPRPEISEWQPLSLTSETVIPFAVMVGLWLAALLASRRPLDFTHLVVMGLTLWQSVEHGRHIPFFALLFGFWMPLHVDALLVRIKERASRDVKQPAPTSPMSRGSQVFFAFALAGVYLLLGERLYRRAHEMPVQLERFPVTAMQYLADRELEGKLVVTYNWAQYAIMAFAPQGAGDGGLLVSLDGRFRTCYPQELIDQHFDFVLGQGPPGTRWRSPNSPPPDPAATLRFGEPDLALLNRNQEHSVRVMKTQTADWVLLYQDELAQIWGRRQRYGQPASPDYIPPSLRSIGNALQEGTVPWPALPTPSRQRAQLADDSAPNPERS